MQLAFLQQQQQAGNFKESEKQHLNNMNFLPPGSPEHSDSKLPSMASAASNGALSNNAAMAALASGFLPSPGGLPHQVIVSFLL